MWSLMWVTTKNGSTRKKGMGKFSRMLDRVAICCFITGWASKSACSRMRMKQPVFWLSAPRMGVSGEGQGSAGGPVRLQNDGDFLEALAQLGTPRQPGRLLSEPRQCGEFPHRRDTGPPDAGTPPKSFWAAPLRKTTFRSWLVTTTGSGNSARSGPRNSTGTAAPPVNAGGTSGRLGGASRPDFISRSFSPA